MSSPVMTSPPAMDGNILDAVVVVVVAIIKLEVYLAKHPSWGLQLRRLHFRLV